MVLLCFLCRFCLHVQRRFFLFDCFSAISSALSGSKNQTMEAHAALDGVQMKNGIAGMVVSVGLLASHGALATPVTIDFTVTASSTSDGYGGPFSTIYGGYAVGALGSGSFSFDDAGGNFYDTTLGMTASNLNFAWLGTNWNSDTARIYDLMFDSSGGLLRWGIGGVSGTCGLNCFNNPGPTDFYMGGFAAGASQGSSGSLHLLGVSGSMTGHVAWSVRPAGVPEPATLSLLGLGLPGIGAARRRQRC
jgi:hypothetical protein